MLIETRIHKNFTTSLCAGVMVEMNHLEQDESKHWILIKDSEKLQIVCNDSEMTFYMFEGNTIHKTSFDDFSEYSKTKEMLSK